MVGAGGRGQRAAPVTGSTLRTAYDSAAEAWGDAPDRLYGALAEALLVRGPVWRGLLVLDVGAGTGTATRRLVEAGAVVVALDAAVAMLDVARDRSRCRPVVGDARALPLSNNAVDAVVMGFVLNHLTDPAAALAEAARVVRPGGWVLASTWARENDHPVKQLVEAGLRERGWVAPPWYTQLKQETAPLTDSAARLATAARRAGLVAVDAARVDVPVALTPIELVSWRLGMPHCAPFVASLSPAGRGALVAELTLATARLPELVCSTVMLGARVGG